MSAPAEWVDPDAQPVEHRHAEACGQLCRDAGDGSCTDCGVGLVVCDRCGGRGYHTAGCPDVEDVEPSHSWRANESAAGALAYVLPGATHERLSGAERCALAGEIECIAHDQGKCYVDAARALAQVVLGRVRARFIYRDAWRESIEILKDHCRARGVQS